MANTISMEFAMMGRRPPYQNKFFVTGFSLDRRIREDHLLRKISEKIDFDFIYEEVKDTYGVKGNVSVPLPVILKLMLLLFLYDVKPERERTYLSHRSRCLVGVT